MLIQNLLLARVFAVSRISACLEIKVELGQRFERRRVDVCTRLERGRALLLWQCALWACGAPTRSTH